MPITNHTLKSWRARRGLSQYQAAIMFGMTAGNYSKVERGSIEIMPYLHIILEMEQEISTLKDVIESLKREGV